MIADIPREVVECVLNPEEVCDVCSSSLQVVGKKTVRTELEYIPAKLKVLEYVQYIFKCSNCGTTEDYPDAVFKKAPVPAPLMPRSLASATSVAWIMYQKYALAVPLYRQEKEWLRMGIALTRSIMSNWVIQCASAWLKPLCERMREKLITYDIVMSDETTIQCNKEEGRKASSNSYFWQHRNGPCEGARSYCLSIPVPGRANMPENFWRVFPDIVLRTPTLGMRRWKTSYAVYVGHT